MSDYKTVFSELMANVENKKSDLTKNEYMFLMNALFHFSKFGYKEAIENLFRYFKRGFINEFELEIVIDQFNKQVLK